MEGGVGVEGDVGAGVGRAHTTVGAFGGSVRGNVVEHRPTLVNGVAGEPVVITCARVARAVGGGGITEGR